MTLLFKALLGATLSSMTRLHRHSRKEKASRRGMPHQYDIELKSLDMDKTILADVPVLSTGI